MEEYSGHFINDQGAGCIAFGIDQPVYSSQNRTIKSTIDILRRWIVGNNKHGSRVRDFKVKIIARKHPEGLFGDELRQIDP